MKYRLDEPAYVNDTLHPAGTEVGDGCAETWRYPHDAHLPELRGKPRPPNRAMTPLDEEGKRTYKNAFESDSPERDPTKAIPITPVERDVAGNVKQKAEPARPGQPNPAPNVPNEPARTGVNVTKDDSVAKEDPLGNRTPEQHKPGEDKPASPASQPPKAK